jgi:hypothetical protein
MDRDQEEDTYAHFERLLTENAENDPPMFESSQKAINESRRLLAEVVRDHPDIL